MKNILLIIISWITCICTITVAQPEAVDQARLEYNRTQVKMEAAYQKILVRVQKYPNSKILMQDLKKSQDRWLIHSQAEASFLAGITSEGGSAYTYDYIYFLTDITKGRITQLNLSLEVLNMHEIK
jgi:uncharacterized protein YecT (DUF1311 family)